jgi:hypothetical protein
MAAPYLLVSHLASGLMMPMDDIGYGAWKKSKQKKHAAGEIRKSIWQRQDELLTDEGLQENKKTIASSFD